MDNKDPWVSYDKVSTSSDAFAYVQEIGNDLSDSLEHLNQGSPVRAKGLPTEKYTAGNTNDVMEGVHEESFLTQTPSKISRRYSPMTKSEYSGYRPPDPVFLSYNNTQTTNTFLPEPLAKHKSIEDIDKVQVNNKFVINKLSSANREAAIAPEALELINILNPVEAREVQSNTTTQEIRAEKYTSSITPIEVKKLETKTNTVVQTSTPIVIGKPKTLTTYNQVNNNNQTSTDSTSITKNEVTEVETAGPTFNNNVNQVTNQNSVTQTNIEVKKPVVTPKLSQYTNTIDFNSFVSSSFAEIVDQKTEQRFLSKNNINVRKLVTDINLFLEQNKREFKNNISNSVNQFFSTYSEENISSLQNSILNVIETSNNIQNLDASVSRIINEYFSKNQNEFNQNLVSNFINNFNLNLQTQLENLQQNSTTEFNTVEEINSAISEVKNIYEAKQIEIAKIISEVNNDNVLTKVVELANTYQDYKTLSTTSINALSNQINQTNITEIKETFNKQIDSFNVRNESSLASFKQEIYGFLYSYLSNSVNQDTFNTLLNSVTSSTNVEQINSIVNEFVSNNRTENNAQAIDSLQYFSNDKYSNIVSSTMIEAIENNILNSLSSVVQSYSNQDTIQNSLINQVKNELAHSFSTEIKNTVNSFGLTELKTSIENVYKSQDINEFKSEFNNALNKSENTNNTQLISYLNSILENNITQYTVKNANVLNETRYANSVKNLVNENLHNVVSNIVHNLSEVNTYSDNKNISTLVNNIKIINDRLLINNAESRLQNFNLIQNSIENFLNNTENSFASSLNNVKTNQSSYDIEIINNLNTIDLLSSNINQETLTEVKNVLNNLSSQSFNEESNKFVQEVKLYTDLINMKNQITSELNNFVNTTFETILEVNQNSTLVSTQQIVNLVEETVSSFNNSSVSNKALSYIQNTLQDTKKPELYNNTFQLITSTNILEDQVKNYLLQNNSVLADYSLQQILNTINQPVYSDYATFQEIKEIINKSTNTSSFGILSEIKQYINHVNSQENAQFISNLKTYLTENQNNQSSVNNIIFTEELKSFISDQNSYSPETFNQVINSVTNKFENKSALILNNIINENVAKLNQVVETLYSSISSNQSKETILNTLSTFVNNNASYSDADNNFLTEETNNFKQENNDFIENLNNLLSSNNNTLSEEIKNDIKNQIFNNISSQVLAVVNKNDINNQQINNIIQSSNAVELKTNDIRNYLSELENIYQNSVFVNEIKYAQSFLKNESTKIEVLSTSSNFNNTNLDTVIQNVINNNQQSQSVQVITNLSLSKIDQFKNLVYNSDTVDVLNTFIGSSSTNILNDTKIQISGLIQTFNLSEVIKQELISQVNSSLSLIDIEKVIESTSVNVSSAQTRILQSVANENKFISNLMNSVSETFKNEIINNKTEVESYVNIALVEYLQNKFEKHQSSPVYKSETYLESLTKFIETNVTNFTDVLGTVKEVAKYATGDQVSVNNLIKTVDNLYRSGTFNNTENNKLTFETFEKNNIEFLNTINNAFSNYNVEEISTTLNNLSNDIISSTQSNIGNISNSTSSEVNLSNINISNLDEVENLINNISEYQSNNILNLREEILLNSLKSYIANEYVKISMLKNIINQTQDIKQVYTYNSESSSQMNFSQEEQATFIQNQNQEFLNQYTQEFISENLSSSSSVSNVTNSIVNNYVLSNLSTQAVETVNNINQMTSSSEINNYSTRLEEKSYNEAKTLLSSIMQEMGKTEISQMILNSVSSSDLKNIVQNNFNNLNTFEKNIAEKTLNESFYISNKLNEAINIFNQDVKENSTNISSYIATQTLTNLIQNYINNQVNNSSVSLINNLPRTSVNQAFSLANALSIINKEDVVSNLLTLNENAFSNNNQENRYQITSFKFDQEFKDAVQNITTNSNVENIATELSTFKQEILNNTFSTVNDVMNQSNIKVENYESVVKNQYLTADEKIENILQSLNVAINSQSLSIQETRNLEMIRNYVLSESYKIDVLNKISLQEIFHVNNFELFENEISTKIQQSITSPSFVETVNNFRTQISQKNSAEEIKNYSAEQKTIILNEVKNIVSDFVSVVNPEYLTTENLNILDTSTSIEQFSNILSENKNKFTSSENTTLSNILNQSLVYSEIIESVTNSILNDNNFTENTLLQKVDNVVYETIQKQISTMNETLIRDIITNIEQYNISDSTSNQEIDNLISSLVNNTLEKQELYFNDLLNSFNIKNINNQINTYNQEIIRSVSTVVQNYDVSRLLTNTLNENITLNQNIINSDVIGNVNQILEKNNYSISDLLSIQNNLTDIKQNNFTSENIVTSNQNIINKEIIKQINNVLRESNYDVSSLITNNNTFNNDYKSIMNSEVIENLKNVLEGTTLNSKSVEEIVKNYSSSQMITQQIQNSLNSNTVRNLFNRSLVNELTRNSSTVRTLLEEKATGNQTNLFNQYLNKIYQNINEIKTSVNNEVKNEVERLENITLNFENQATYQKSSIQVYDEVTNKFEADIPNGFDKVNLNESVNNLETNTTNNNFRNITVVKQIDENEDVQVSNLRIEKVWNKFVQEEVNKIVEEVNNQTESTNQENIYNQQNTTVNQNSRTENFNKSEINYNSGDVYNTENKSEYNTFNTQHPDLNTSTKETEERINYREITEVVFTRIEEKLRTFSVTEEDIIILKHKILNEVTEIYEKKSKVDIQKSEEKMKKEMQDLFIKFLNS